MANGERFRNVRGRNPQANPFIIIGIMWTMIGIAFGAWRTWAYFGITFFIVGMNKRNAG
jgi:hypothetical protein